MFAGVIPERRSWSRSRVGSEGLRTNSPSFAVRLTSVPAPKPTSSAKPRGILTPRLFPHFWTFVCMPLKRLYRDYTILRLGCLRPISLTPQIRSGQESSTMIEALAPAFCIWMLASCHTDLDTRMACSLSEQVYLPLLHRHYLERYNTRHSALHRNSNVQRANRCRHLSGSVHGPSCA